MSIFDTFSFMVIAGLCGNAVRVEWYGSAAWCALLAIYVLVVGSAA